jgi:hypothetical protein
LYPKTAHFSTKIAQNRSFFDQNDPNRSFFDPKYLKNASKTPQKHPKTPQKHPKSMNFSAAPPNYGDNYVWKRRFGVRGARKFPVCQGLEQVN